MSTNIPYLTQDNITYMIPSGVAFFVYKSSGQWINDNEEIQHKVCIQNEAANSIVLVQSNVTFACHCQAAIMCTVYKCAVLVGLDAYITKCPTL